VRYGEEFARCGRSSQGHIWIFDVVGFVVCHIEAVLVCLTGCMRKPEEI
jgi:hypothetical protein